MTKSKLLAGIAIATLLTATSGFVNTPLFGSAPAMAQSASVSFNVFFDELQPHGLWVRHPQYRYVWCPAGVSADWRPYTQGRWIYLADYGWYFASDEPFAWAVYHYGRWHDDDNLGWCWVPGTRWAPAWVSWRRSDEFVGWAPLPPESDGFSVEVNVTQEDLPETNWFFVPVANFVEPDLSVNIVFGDRDPDLFARTEFVGPVVVQNNVVVNNVIDIDFIQQQINQDITVYNVEATDQPETATVSSDTNVVQIFNQDIAAPEEEAAPPEAVEPEEAQQELGQPAEEAEPPAGEEAAPEAPAEEAPAPEAGEEAPPETPPAEEEAVPPAEADQPAAEEPAPEEPAAEEPAAPEQPPAAEEEAAPAEEAAPEAPAEEAPPVAEPEAPAEEAAPEAAPQEEAAPEQEAPAEAQPPAPEAAPEAQPPAAEEEAIPEEAAPAEEEAAPEPPCPPETMVNGACPVEGGAPAGEQPAPAPEAPPAQ